MNSCEAVFFETASFFRFAKQETFPVQAAVGTRVSPLRKTPREVLSIR